MIVTDIDDTWSADLVDMQAFARYNKGIKYLLTVIDVFSKYAWVVPLKDKTGKSVTEAFVGLVEQGRHPNNLWVDEGTEFYNKTFKKFLEDNKINMYHTFNFGKAVVIERFNRTLKQIMWKYFTANNTNTYLNNLPDMVKKYNNTKHRSIKMSPTNASKSENKGNVYFNLYGGDKRPSRSESSLKHKIGDKVRISKLKRHFEKGYTPNWTEEIFVIDEILNTNPVTYRLKDLNQEEIKGTFYEQELSKAKQEIFRIEKIIKKDYKNQRALVKWKGYSKDFNNWVKFSDII